MASIDNNFNWNLIPDEFVIFDVETTGLDFSNDRIIEIGAIIFNKKESLTELKNNHLKLESLIGLKKMDA